MSNQTKKLARNQAVALRKKRLGEFRARKKVHDRIWGRGTQAPDPLLASLRVKLCRRLIEITESIPTSLNLEPVYLYDAVERWSAESKPDDARPPEPLVEWWNDLVAHNKTEKAMDHKGSWGKPLCSQHAKMVGAKAKLDPRSGDQECGICGAKAEFFATHGELEAEDAVKALNDEKTNLDPIERARRERRERG